MKTKTILLSALLFAAVPGFHAAAAPAAADIVVCDFEFDNWAAAGWTVTGEAFGAGPVPGTFPHHRPPGGFGNKGRRFVNTFLGGKDGLTGTATSPAFAIERRYIHFLIGAGGWEGKTCVNLLVDGKAVRTATGDQTRPARADGEILVWKKWDVADLAGKQAVIEIVDAPHKGNWLHINLDHIVQSDRPSPPAPDAPAPAAAASDDAAATQATRLLGDLLKRKFIPPQTPGTPVYKILLDELEARNGRDGLTFADELRAANQFRDRLLADSHRPRYHLLPPEGGFTYDPNGALFHKGRYHLFILHNEPVPASLVLAGKETFRKPSFWIHASSADLLHWRWHPPIRPVLDGTMPDGLFSGGAVTGADKPTLVFHINGHGTCIYTSDDDNLDHWSPHPENPVIPQKQPGGVEYRVFDPHVWREADAYYALIGNRNKRPGYEGDTNSVFRSPDLLHWEYLHPLYKSRREWTHVDSDAACPDFFPIGNGKHMLVTHVHGPMTTVQYYIGTYANHTFAPEQHGLMSWAGGPLGAPETLLDGKGRRIFWAWVREAGGRRPQAWESTVTLPRVLSLDKNNNLLITPPEELKQLRANPRALAAAKVPAGGELVPPKNFRGDVAELLVTFPAGLKKPFGLKVRRSADAREYTTITVNPEKQTLVVGLDHSTLDPAINYPVLRGAYMREKKLEQQFVREQTAPLALAPGEPLTLRVFLDRSVLEIYANDRQCVTQRVYPTLPDAAGVSLFSEGGAIEGVSVEMWDISPTNPW
ncbi:MAG: glycoside hydrolase family 32 protein [Opitutaceae bacterium]|jgi:sucrose-6-phosphate hydrolase SacC (GH32 family)|nr:glycoside hydrolase family 32 protein [Opitutaceae bacterium]